MSVASTFARCGEIDGCRLRDQLKKKHRVAGDRDLVAGQHFAGQREAVPVKRSKASVWTGFRVPASIARAAVRLEFWVRPDGDPAFSVVAVPWQATQRLEAKDRQLLAATRALNQAGFQSGYENADAIWWTERGADEYIDHGDVPSRLIDLAERDLVALVASGVLSHDLRAATIGGRRGPPKVKSVKR